MPTFRRPTRQEVAAAHGKTLADLIAPGLRVVFCGINPSLYSAAVGHHFARPGNRFWPALHASGFTGRVLSPAEDAELLALGCGITNLVDRATASAEELAPEELIEGLAALERKVLRYRPEVVAVLGMTAYRTAFRRRQVQLGPQEGGLAGADLWVLPNPSGLNAHYQVADLARVYGELRRAARMPTAAPTRY